MPTPLQTAPLSLEQIEALREFDTPTVSNALELIDPTRDRQSGIVAPRIKAVFPEKKPLVGYASTFLMATKHPAPTKKFHVEWADYWRYILSVPEPRVSVGQDIDPAPSTGSLWGEIQTNIHLALGCVGVVLEGAIRDVAAIRPHDYPCFAREIVVGHAYAHIMEFGIPVEVGDVVVNPADLIHADCHGVIVIPQALAPDLVEMCRKILEVESHLIAVCQDRDHFTLDRLIKAYEKFASEYPELERPTI